MKKICPLLYANEKIVDACCREYRCAWWDPVEEECALLVIAVFVSAPVKER